MDPGKSQGHLNMRIKTETLAALVIMVSAPVVLWRATQSNMPTQNESIGGSFQKHTGLDGRKLTALLNIHDKVGSRKPITDDEWRSIVEASESPNLEFRVNSLISLHRLVGTKYEEGARNIARRLSSDPDPGTRCVALGRLVAMHDHTAKSELVSALRSENAQVVERAKKLSRELSKP